MKIKNCGSGLHQREVKCAQRLTDALPKEWYAFSNLDLVLGRGNTREVDLIIVSDQYIFVVDVKDWNGTIESEDGNWTQNGLDRGPSPVKKITEIKRKIFEKLQNNLKNSRSTNKLSVPRVHGIVLISGNASYDNVSDFEKESIYKIENFIKILNRKEKIRDHFGNVPYEHIDNPLTTKNWKGIISKFFNVSNNSIFLPGKRRFLGYIAEDAPTFIHPDDVYSEFDAYEEATPLNTTTIRFWDFTKCSNARFQTEDGRNEIAGRERNIFHWLRERNSISEKYLLTPTAHDPDKSIEYWEAFERRKNQKRLSNFLRTESFRLTKDEKIELVRQLLAAVSALHDCGAAHLDIGAHSIWLEAPTSVKLSHLLASHIPDGPSLGIDRYNFLSSVKLPEAILEMDSPPQCRDVYLTGVAAHALLFGETPKGSPPEWDPEVDQNEDFSKLHGWFSSILESDPSARTKTCSDALSLFNKLTALSPSTTEIIQEIQENFSSIKSQIQAAQMFPQKGEMMKDTNAVQTWLTEKDSTTYIVKIWKQPSFGDLQKNSRKIRSFLNRAKNIAADRPTELSKVKHFSWLQDAILITQEWIDGKNLDEFLSDKSKNEFDGIHNLKLAERLLENTVKLHEQGITHGDLRPSNVIVDEGGNITFIDHLDFELEMDGAKSVSEYTPSFGGAFERDRYAAICMCRTILRSTENDIYDCQSLERHAEACIENEPALATVEPFLSAVKMEISNIESPKVDEEATSLCISVVGAEIGRLESDEGKFYFRFRESGTLNFLHIRGACEELMVAVSPGWEVKWVKRQRLAQIDIIKRAKHEFFSLEMLVEIVGNGSSNFEALDAFIKDFEFVEKINSGSTSDRVAASDEANDLHDLDNASDTDTNADILAEKISREIRDNVEPNQESDEHIDVSKLWRELVDYEEQLSIEGRAPGGCSYDRRLQLTKIPFELEIGQFDFNREDKVIVSKAIRDGKWLQIGQMDVRQSRPDLVYLDSVFDNGKLYIEEDARLKFESFFAGESLRRRKEAVEKMLGASGRSSDLLSSLDPQTGFRPIQYECEIDEKAIKGYKLNADQENALRGIVANRPLGLVQGPPGTGKTRLIAALTHYALSHNLARSVLISSQSHEAVNTSVDGVLKHFVSEGEKPSVLRVGANEASVSANLQQYFSKRIEQEMKDKFSASFRNRIAVAANALGIPEHIADKVTFVETTIHDISNTIGNLLDIRPTGEAPDKSKLNSLLSTLEQQLDSLEVQNINPAETSDWSDFTDTVISAIKTAETRALGISDDTINRLRSIVRLAKDFIGSTTSTSRSFEPFLAGTRHIVAGTCVGLGRRSLGLTDMAFDLVIVDEAARCTSSELLVPLQAARWAVLVGDHAQLQPHHEPGIVEAVSAKLKIKSSEVVRSDFERVFNSAYSESAGFSMREQYRMLPAINQLISESFYKNLELTAGRVDPIIPRLVLPDELNHEVTWIETDELGESAFDQVQSGGSSRINESEAEIISNLVENWCEKPEFLRWLSDQENGEPKIGIICMYAAQRDLIRRKINMKNIGQLLDKFIKIGTVDSYQGKENPIVILSLVRNNRNGDVVNDVRTIRDGFLSTPNRINVGLSRAMDRLVIVGNRKSWKPGTPVNDAALSFSSLHHQGQSRVISANTFSESFSS